MATFFPCLCFAVILASSTPPIYGVLVLGSFRASLSLSTTAPSPTSILSRLCYFTSYVMSDHYRTGWSSSPLQGTRSGDFSGGPLRSPTVPLTSAPPLPLPLCPPPPHFVLLLRASRLCAVCTFAHPIRLRMIFLYFECAIFVVWLATPPCPNPDPVPASLASSLLPVLAPFPFPQACNALVRLLWFILLPLALLCPPFSLTSIVPRGTAPPPWPLLPLCPALLTFLHRTLSSQEARSSLALSIFPPLFNLSSDCAIRSSLHRPIQLANTLRSHSHPPANLPPPLLLPLPLVELELACNLPAPAAFWAPAALRFFLRVVSTSGRSSPPDSIASRCVTPPYLSQRALTHSLVYFFSSRSTRHS